MVFPEPLAPPHDGRYLVRRNCDRHVVQRLGRVRPVVLERHAPELQVDRIRYLAIRSPSTGSSSSFSCTSERRSSEIFASCVACTSWMNCDSGALSCQMMYCRATIMPSVIWPSMTAEAARDHDILRPVDERAAHLLRLPQHEPLDRDLEQPRLDAFSLPALLLLAVVELDLLHAAYVSCTILLWLIAAS